MKIVVNHFEDHADAIDCFVGSRPEAVAAHQSVWLKILRDGMRQQPSALSAWRDGQVVGWLPLVETNSLLFGRHVVSLPYVNEAGVLAEERAVSDELIEQAGALARQRRARFVELRNATSCACPRLTAVRSDKLRMSRSLPGQTDALWNSIPSKVRNQVRKGRSAGLSVRWGGAELLDAFHNVFTINMRDLGSPAYGQRHFAAMLSHLGRDAELCVVELDGRAIAGAILTHFRRTTEVPSASALRRYNHTCVNMLMYWHLLERAIERGSEVFDFGRSSIDSGTYRFKHQWGADGTPMGWQHLTLRRKAAPVTRDTGNLSRAVELWRRLPLWVTRIAGPALVRGIP